MTEAVEQLEHHLIKWIEHRQARQRALHKLNIIKEVLVQLSLNNAELRKELIDAKARPQRHRKASGSRKSD